MIAHLSISILWLPLIILVSAYAGYFFRSAQLAKARKRILSLENEMLGNHAEILKLQQEIVQIEKDNNLSTKSRVVLMKDKDVHPEENPDAAQKKSINNK